MHLSTLTEGVELGRREPDSHREGQSVDTSSYEVSHVLNFIRFVSPLVFGFAALEAVAFSVFRDTSTGLTGACLFAYGLVLLAARWSARRGALRTALSMICAGFLVATLFTALADPSLVSTLVLTPLLAVGVALPYAGDRLLRLLIVSAWIMIVIVGTFGELLSPFSALPAWYDNFFHVASLATASGLALLLLWQFRTRLNDRTLERIRKAEERYALAERGAKDGLWDWNLRTGKIYFSPRWKEMLGCSDKEIGDISEDWFTRIHPDDEEGFRAELMAHLSGLKDHLEHEYRIMYIDGSYRWMLVRGIAERDEKGQATRMAGSQTDVTRRKEAEERALYDAAHDSLTGLPNRTLLNERLLRIMKHAKGDSGYTCALLFLDLDRFKNVNDSLGHSLGDLLLIEVARKLEECVHPTDTVARLGGDEFVILLEDLSDPDDAARIAERLQKELAQPLKLRGHQLYTTASIGIVVNPDSYTRPEDLLRDADTAMYQAKEDGKARHVIFDPTMRTRAISVLRLETDLRRAIEQREFVVHYQPIVYLKSGRVVSFEALVRWQHPGRGLIMPHEFIPLAEETGLIEQIGLFVLREACQQVTLWRERFPNQRPLGVSVNLSAIQLTSPNLADSISEILEETSLKGRDLVLEITESAIMRDERAAVEMFSRLKRLGVRLHVDDFGTGYSSLGALHRYPVDALKIDRSFVGRMEASGENVEIVQTISTLAHQLGMYVVAEGAETSEQLKQLRAINCDYGQGYRFSEPANAPTAEAILAAEPSW